PSARIAVMGGEQASQTLLSIRLQASSKEKESLQAHQGKLLEEIKNRYEDEMDPKYAAARLWVDDIIDPLSTREVISRGIEMANNNPNMKLFNVGVLQT
ncbi:MAG: acyl-CoA carboxylase subunit beta, partial [Bacteroidetes bacterium]|nr:acyl-CoA carboxylase subunit beta [Bacteroidota bacterium]